MSRLVGSVSAHLGVSHQPAVHSELQLGGLAVPISGPPCACLWASRPPAFALGSRKSVEETGQRDTAPVDRMWWLRSPQGSVPRSCLQAALGGSKGDPQDPSWFLSGLQAVAGLWRFLCGQPRRVYDETLGPKAPAWLVPTCPWLVLRLVPPAWAGCRACLAHTPWPRLPSQKWCWCPGGKCFRVFWGHTYLSRPQPLPLIRTGWRATWMVDSVLVREQKKQVYLL